MFAHHIISNGLNCALCRNFAEHESFVGPPISMELTAINHGGGLRVWLVIFGPKKGIGDKGVTHEGDREAICFGIRIVDDLPGRQLYV